MLNRVTNGAATMLERAGRKLETAGPVVSSVPSSVKVGLSPTQRSRSVLWNWSRVGSGSVFFSCPPYIVQAGPKMPSDW